MSPWSAAVRPGLPPRSMRRRKGLSVAVFDCRAFGGQAGASARIENYLGFPTGISGQALAGRAFNQAQKFGAEMLIPVSIRSLDCSNARRRCLRWRPNAGSRCRQRSIVVASGARYRRPEIENLDAFEGRGVWYWASPIEAKLCAESGGRAGRRRQLRRTGRGVSVQPCAQGLHDDPRRRPRRQHVALSDRAHRGDAEHRTDLQRRGGRPRRRRRTPR